jgi:hypothetical protein
MSLAKMQGIIEQSYISSWGTRILQAIVILLNYLLSCLAQKIKIYD